MEHLLLTFLLSPFLGAVILFFVPYRSARLIRGVALLSALPPLGGALWLLKGYDLTQGGFQFVHTYPILPGMGLNLTLGVDGISVALLFLTAFIYLTAIFTSWTIQKREKEFFLFMALLVTGVFGVFISLDLFLFFLFYELAVLPMYLLIGIWGSTKEIPGKGPFAWTYEQIRVGVKEYGAMKLTLYLLVGSAFILVALFRVYVESGASLGHPTFNFLQLQQAAFDPGVARLLFLLFYVGFGVLAGIWPLHTWSPDGHAAAPAAGSMMHAGVLMKLGAYGVLRVGFGLFPSAAHELAWIVGTIAAINILYGALAAGWQRDIKYLIAYSSVSHMGIVMLGMATLNEPGIAGSVFQMVSHGIMTGLLFTIVNLVYHKSHTRDMTQMGGFAHRMPVLATFFALAGFTSLGLPGLSGFVAEFLVFLGAWTSAHPWWLIPGVLGAFITAIYVLRAFRWIFLGPENPQHPDLPDARGTEVLSMVILGAILILLGLYPRLLLDAIHTGVVEFLAHLGGA